MRVERVFCYGTLKPGEIRYNSIKHMIQEEATVDGIVTGVSLYNYFNKYPFVDIVHNDSHQVHGKLLAVKQEFHEEIINVLDMIEGYPHLFERDYFSVRLDDGQRRVAVMYYGRSEHLLDNGTLIESGEW